MEKLGDSFVFLTAGLQHFSTFYLMSFWNHFWFLECSKKNLKHKIRGVLEGEREGWGGWNH